LEGFVSYLKESLDQILAIDGVQTVALIDIATGMVVRSAGNEDPRFAAVAAGVADEAKIARCALGPRQPGGDLDEITAVTADRLHLSKILDSQLDEGLLLFVDLDRARANIALASLRVGQAAPAVLA
jgi:hypothetical protein